MKRILLLLIILLFGTDADASIPFVRIGESYPDTNCVRIPGREQLTGQQFQQDIILSYKGYQYTVYYNDTRNVCIARRFIPSVVWEKVMLPYRNTEDDSHNTISMGICANDGTIHLAYDHHNSPLHYCRSVIGLANDPANMEWSQESFSLTTSQMEEGIEVPDVTYPRFIAKPDGNLLFECRFHYSGYGDSYLREYDGNTHTWSLIGRYVQGLDTEPDAYAYINGMTYDNRERLHVTWCWRDDFGGGSNHDFYYGYSEDHGRTWKDNLGNQVAVTEYMEPLVVRTTGECMGQTKNTLMVESIPYYRGYINQETQAVDSKNRIHAVNSHMPEGMADDTDWDSSRRKAQLHHRFRDGDGNWKKRIIKDNDGNPVHSYCRVHLAFDAADNAYVIANGAEVYVATSGNNYNDWSLLTDIDKGRFISEPHVDRSLLLNGGVLSYVYLSDDGRLVVVDYLLDNPHIPDGNGLFAEYFSDTAFGKLIRSENNVQVSATQMPAETKSVRWSGEFETLYAEEYTLYLTTTSQTKVSIDNKMLLETETTSESRVYEMKVPAIASHKHTIVIESVETSDNIPMLEWSSDRTIRETLPRKVLYGEKVNPLF